MLIFPTFYAMTGGLILQWLLGYNFSVGGCGGLHRPVWIAVETGVSWSSIFTKLWIISWLRYFTTNADIEAAAIEGQCKDSAQS